METSRACSIRGGEPSGPSAVVVAEAVEASRLAFEKHGGGSLRFVAVEGQLDWHTSTQGQGDRVEFTWEGDDEGDRVSGRGWAQVDEDGSLRGHIYFHLGDDSGFRAVRESSAAT